MESRKAEPGPGPGVRPAPLLAWLVPLLCLDGGLVALWAATDSTLLLVLYVLVSLTIFATGVASAARWARERGQTEIDEARLNELEPLPPAPAADREEEQP
ncbi:hypothetical protein [Streptomyces hoynatensis]|uniref:Uncharacterized protein n=1 Tax=Streptomyces hoynatensis TaxID=1141874 RepID=A0A3A9YWU9_9ACTN|nr:hypothetical protein [Streptomyces hoynatensis]RKN39717.1 hypothetical protein D7294_19940 [Streptomyces hoynatensis]